VHEDGDFMASGKLHLRFKQERARYVVEVTLDDSLAYRNEFIERNPLL
jgi:hypothetical protein